MADDAAVKFSFGAVAGWIENAAAAAPVLINHDAALNHLAVIEAAYDEYRKNIVTLRTLIADAKRRLDAASTL